MVIFLRSESNGISSTISYASSSSPFQMPALAAALRSAPSVGSPKTAGSAVLDRELRAVAQDAHGQGLEEVRMRGGIDPVCRRSRNSPVGS